MRQNQVVQQKLNKEMLRHQLNAPFSTQMVFSFPQNNKQEVNTTKFGVCYVNTQWLEYRAEWRYTYNIHGALTLIVCRIILIAFFRQENK